MDPFEQSADMRLLELQRKALGIEAPPRPNWSAQHAETAEGIPLEEEAPPVLTGARITVDCNATPNQKLIPGAVVTVSLAVHNAGDRDTTGVRVTVPVPGDAEYRPGSLRVDGRRTSASEADALFGGGFLVPLLAAGQRTGFVWQLSVQPGLKNIVVAPRVSATGAGISGGKPVLLARGQIGGFAPPPAPAASESEPERPFYELDEAEARDFEREVVTGEDKAALHEAPLVMMPDIVAEPEVPQAPPAPAPELQPAQPEPAAAQPEPAAAQPEPPAAEPEPATAEPEPAAVQPEPDTAKAPAEPRLFCGFDLASLGVVQKLFAAESFGQIPHYILQNALACSYTSGGADFGLRAHLAQQSGVLSRALLMCKLKKAMRVEDFSAGKTDFDLAPGLERPEPGTPSRLFAALTQAEVDFCAPVEPRNPLETFVRIRQLAVALQARTVETDDAALKERLESLLAQYAAGARAAINRTFVKAKLDKNYDPFGAADAAADAIAHDLIDALAQLLAA